MKSIKETTFKCILRSNANSLTTGYDKSNFQWHKREILVFFKSYGKDFRNSTFTKFKLKYFAKCTYKKEYSIFRQWKWKKQFMIFIRTWFFFVKMPSLVMRLCQSSFLARLHSKLNFSEVIYQKSSKFGGQVQKLVVN